MSNTLSTAEHIRLQENSAKDIPLELWGPYLSERQWGTVREDYSNNGDAWNYFTHDQARSRAYRWGEDGIAGICDYRQNLCFAIALWNGKDPILKERLFGLTNQEGNHGEDVKELYYYLDNLPSHYYMKYLYKYPQLAYPYNDLVTVNRNRSKHETEYEILDTGVFNNNQYFDVEVTYAKENSEDIYIRIEVKNRYHEAASITILPTLWFRNTWQYKQVEHQPVIELHSQHVLQASHDKLGKYYFYFSNAPVLFTDNDTNQARINGSSNATPFVKDAFHNAIIHGQDYDLLVARRNGTKCSPVYKADVEGKSSHTIYLRLSSTYTDTPFNNGFERIFDQRLKEADEFYKSVMHPGVSSELALIQRQAYAGLLWSKQFYHYDVERWLDGDNGKTALPRTTIRNSSWKNIKNKDVILMPDKWEYPWYAAWDLAFHCIAIAPIDPGFAKNQLIILTREWYMNANGQIPAYEWDFNDVNPPVHAWAALQVYMIEKQRIGAGDVTFLKKIFLKLLINFTWWANRKDATGNNIFEGGFLGLDNIGVFNRSVQLPGEVALEQADATSWMAMYALNMMDIAIELSTADSSFEHTATKFYEHFVLIADAVNNFGLWNKNDAFYYDILNIEGADLFSLRLRSVVGLSPLFAVSLVSKKQFEYMPDFKARMAWLNKYMTDRSTYMPVQQAANEEHLLFSIVDEEKLVALVEKVLDETEFLSPGGVRALSKYYGEHPYSTNINGTEYSVTYDPGDSTSGMFGGNSNWRGPVWMPINYLLIKAIRRYAEFYKGHLRIRYPLHSNNYITLQEAADIIAERNISIFQRNSSGERPVHGQYNWFYNQEENKDLLLFYEYFHGETARGLGASHQTGWTALIIDTINDLHSEYPVI